MENDAYISYIIYRDLKKYVFTNIHYSNLFTLAPSADVEQCDAEILVIGDVEYDYFSHIHNWCAELSIALNMQVVFIQRPYHTNDIIYSIIPYITRSKKIKVVLFSNFTFKKYICTKYTNDASHFCMTINNFFRFEHSYSDKIKAFLHYLRIYRFASMVCKHHKVKFITIDNFNNWLQRILFFKREKHTLIIPGSNSKDKVFKKIVSFIKKNVSDM